MPDSTPDPSASTPPPDDDDLIDEDPPHDLYVAYLRARYAALDSTGPYTPHWPRTEAAYADAAELAAANLGAQHGRESPQPTLYCREELEAAVRDLLGVDAPEVAS